jgi:hypothetical protein
MRGAIPLLPQYVFMECCLIKHRDKFNFTLPVREMKWWEAGEDCIMRSFITSTLHQVLLG